MLSAPVQPLDDDAESGIQQLEEYGLPDDQAALQRRLDYNRALRDAASFASTTVPGTSYPVHYPASVSPFNYVALDDTKYTFAASNPSAFPIRRRTRDPDDSQVSSGEPSTPRELKFRSDASSRARQKKSMADIITLRENISRIDDAMVKEYSVGSVSALPCDDNHFELTYFVSRAHGQLDPNVITSFLNRTTKIRNILVICDTAEQTLKIRVHAKDLVVYRSRWWDIIVSPITLLVGVFVYGAFVY